jgi:hypothetical protein
MNKSEIAEDFAKILSPAIDCRAPYAKVMIEKLVERAIAESQGFER